MQEYKNWRPTSYDTRGLNLDSRQDWLVLPVMRNRDSGPMTDSNWYAAIKMLEFAGPKGDEEYVEGGWMTASFNHWMCGWFEIILVLPNSTASKIADEIVAKLDNYPLLDEDDSSEREEKAAQQVWCALSIGERVELCRRDGVSIFAARHQYIPQDDSGRIFEYCRPEE